jgi:hypothetical protein
MRMFLAAAVVGTALATVAASQERQDPATSSSLEQPFVANGTIRMNLSAGEYRISGGSDNRIRVAWSVREPSQLSRVRARADVRGTDATITTDSPNGNFRVTIGVPMRTDLQVRLTAGELTIEHVQGNKDISSHAGEVDIYAGNPADYRRVEASVWAGELHVGPFGRDTEGLFRSFDWTGKGPYTLNAHLKAGELRLHASWDAKP